VEGSIDLEEKVIAMQRKPSILELLGQQSEPTPLRKPGGAPLPPPADSGPQLPEAPLPSLDNLDPLPQPGDPYKAFSRAANQMLPTLYLLMSDATSEGFAYANLDKCNLVKDGPGQPPVIVLRFYGVINSEVRIVGRNMALLYNYLGHHRILWIRQLPEDRNFRGLFAAAETVITGITISDVQKAES
jgi:hypothetical protein